MSRPIIINNENHGGSRSSNLSHLYLHREGDQERIKEFYQSYKELSKQDLIDKYNQGYRLGFVGVHAQALSMIALHFCFLKSFGKSAFTFEANTILEFTGEIEMMEENFVNKQ